MKKIIVIALIGGCIIACSEAEKKQSKSAAVAKKVAKVDGEKIYKTNCVTCHGTRGDMGASGAFNLVTSELTVEERIAVVTNGRNTMASFKSLLNEEKIKAVAEYTMKLTQKGKKE
ncbi:MAG: cytochrome c [Bacteroidota bacterium]